MQPSKASDPSRRHSHLPHQLRPNIPRIGPAFADRTATDITKNNSYRPIGRPAARDCFGGNLVAMATPLLRSLKDRLSPSSNVANWKWLPLMIWKAATRFGLLVGKASSQSPWAVTGLVLLPPTMTAGSTRSEPWVSSSASRLPLENACGLIIFWLTPAPKSQPTASPHLPS